MPVYAGRIFLENAIEMVSNIPSNIASEVQTFRNHYMYHLASSHRTQWKHLVFISERVSFIHVWRTPFYVVPIHRTVHHKNESWTDSISLSRKIQMCSCVTCKCTRISGNFSLMLSIFVNQSWYLCVSFNLACQCQSSFWSNVDTCILSYPDSSLSHVPRGCMGTFSHANDMSFDRLILW